MDKAKIAALREKAIHLPETPGVYMMKDAGGEVIYVGKAKNLKNRVTSYFTAVESHNRKTYALVSNIDRFDVMKTRTEMEALLLERNLIKEYMPQYNVLLRDDKGLCYIELVEGRFPVLRVADRKPSAKVFFGPYYTKGTAKSLLDSAGRVFMLPECGKVVPKERPCLCYHIGRCLGPCAGKVSEKDYAEAVDGAVRFLKGDTEGVAKKLTSEMEKASERLDFEKAAFYRDRLAALEKIGDSQKIIFKEAKSVDAVGVVRSESNMAVCVLPVRNGVMLSATLDVPTAADGDSSLLFQFLLSHYSSAEALPRKIYLSEPLSEAELFSDFLFEKTGKKISLTVPKKGSTGDSILSYSLENAKEYLIGYEQNWQRSERAADDLYRLLGLETAPRRIEMFDISHTAGSDTVGGMTVFEDFKPKKSDYRRFAIAADTAGDDAAATREMISRRLDDYISGKEGFTVLPDLILADGGRAQMNIIAAEVEKRGLSVPVAGLKKDSHHRTKSLVTEASEIRLADRRELWTELSRMQDEVHRFAISYHKQKRSQSVKGLTLQKIEGMGPKKARLVLARFKSMTALRAASEEEILSVKGLDKKTAKSLADALKNGEI